MWYYIIHIIIKIITLDNYFSYEQLFFPLCCNITSVVLL